MSRRQVRGLRHALLVFRRMTGGKQGEGAPSAASLPAGGAPRHHPLLGALKGLVRVMPGTDLTKPADPSWGEK
jgi:hypothetical protein